MIVIWRGTWKWMVFWRWFPISWPLFRVSLNGIKSAFPEFVEQTEKVFYCDKSWQGEKLEFESFASIKIETLQSSALLFLKNSSFFIFLFILQNCFKFNFFSINLKQTFDSLNYATIWGFFQKKFLKIFITLEIFRFSKYEISNFNSLK